MHGFEISEHCCQELITYYLPDEHWAFEKGPVKKMVGFFYKKNVIKKIIKKIKKRRKKFLKKLRKQLFPKVYNPAHVMS